MRIVTLLENTACVPALCAAHGLSLYVETPRHKVLFDMGPDERFLRNAETLGIDLGAVDAAVLSHGHYDHGGGLRAFCEANTHADIFIHMDAFGDFYAAQAGKEPRYIGLDPEIWELESRIVPTADAVKLDEELQLFSAVPDVLPAGAAADGMLVRTPEGLRPDPFTHEQSLLVTAQGKAVLLAGCAHRGIVNIVAAAKERLGRMPDAVFGGFHFFQLPPDDPASARLIDETGKALLEGGTVYYTGHCTGEYAYERLHAILGDRLRRMSGGTAVEI